MEASQLYRNSVMQALSGFQLVEEMLKGYLDSYFTTVRTLLGGKLEFGFSRSDYEDAALGRLVQVFSKVCANKDLVRDLQSARRDRDHLAHKSLLRLYDIPPPSEDEFMRLLEEANRMMNVPSSLMTRIVNEMKKLNEPLGG